MKKWQTIIAVFYLIAVNVLAWPGYYLIKTITYGNNFKWENIHITKIYLNYPYWLLMLVILLGQVVLLFTPVNNPAQRLKPTRRLLIPIIFSGFFFAVLVFASLTSFISGIWSGDEFNKSLLFKTVGETGFFILLYGIPIIIWIFWAILFYKYSKSHDGETVIYSIIKKLMVGSVFELLIAIPSHIIARNRNDCCATPFTALGIMTGLPILLFCFGPGIYFLYQARIKRKLRKE